MDAMDFKLNREKDTNVSLFSLKLNASMKSFIRKHNRDDVWIEFSSGESGFVHIGKASFPFSVRQENSKECYIIDSESSMAFVGDFKGRILIEQTDMNEETKAALKQKTELAKADKIKRKAITVSGDKVISSKRVCLAAPREVRGSLQPQDGSSKQQSNAKPPLKLPMKLPVLHQSAPLPLNSSKPAIPSTTAPAHITPSLSSRALQQEPEHSWIVFRSLPLTVSARHLIVFLDGIQLSGRTTLQSNTLSMALEIGSVSVVPKSFGVSAAEESGEFRMLAVFKNFSTSVSIEDCVGVDVYVELLTPNGAVVAEKRNGEPLQVDGPEGTRGTLYPQIVRSGGSTSLSLAEVFWAKGLGLELSGRRSAEDTLRTILEDYKQLPPALLLSPRGSLTPPVLVSQWPSFTNLFKKSPANQSKTHIFHLNPLEHRDFLGPGHMLVPTGQTAEWSESDSQHNCSRLDDISSLLDALGNLWVIIATLSGSDEGECRASGQLSTAHEDHIKRRSHKVVTNFLARAIQTFRCLKRYVQLEGY